MRKGIVIAVVVAVLAAATWLVLRERPSTTSASAAGPLDYPRGPHGARLLSADDLRVEVTIFETGVPPHFRVYPYDGEGKPIAPSEVQLTVELHRLGGRIDRMTFVPEADYLLGQGVVEEPHSFDVKVVGIRSGQRREWSYAQIEGKVQLSDAVLKSTGIDIQTVGSRAITTVVEVPGQILVDDTRVAQVVARLGGTAVSVSKKVGDSVRRGDVLAVVHSRELADARAAYLAASRHTEFARGAAIREEALWKKKISPEQDYLSAKRDFEEAQLAESAAGQKLMTLGDTAASLKALADAPADALPRFDIRAPLDGVVLERDVTAGEAVAADRAMFTIGDLSSVLVETAISAADVGNVKVGQTATVQSKDLGLDVTGRIAYLSPRIDADTRRATARIAIANTDGRWRPGLFVTVRLVQTTATVAMAVPVEAIQTFRDWQVVFFRFGDWFEARPLALGRSDGTWVEILSGLKPGDRYAATNSFAIKAEIGKLGATHDH